MKICVLLLCLIAANFKIMGQSSTDTTAIEVLPHYPGGQSEFYKYINSERKFPASAATYDYQGVVVITFSVDTSGLVIVNDLNFDRMKFKKRKVDEAAKLKTKEDISTEIKRLFESMPKWAPATRNGKPVRVKFSIPYSFELV